MTLCQCGHRPYDHDTADGTCWKCDCLRYVPVDLEEPREPDIDPQDEHLYRDPPRGWEP